MASKYKLVVFDWDGTIVDSVGQIIRCKTQLAQRYQVTPPSAEQVRAVLGQSFDRAMRNAFPQVAPKLLEKLKQEFHQMMQASCYRGQLFPDAAPVLHQLNKQGLILAVATAKSRCELDIELQHTGLDGIFAATCCSEEFVPKPDPFMLHYLMQKFALVAEQCLVVGDTVSDMVFAKRANIDAIAVSFGAHSVEKLSAMQPLAIIDQWRALLRYLA